VLAEFRSYLDSRKLRYTQAELDENREMIVRLVEARGAATRCSGR